MATPPAEELHFTLLWTRAEPAVASFIHGLVRNRQAADELVQEVAVAAFRSFAQWRPEGTFTQWSLGIAHNVVKMRWRTIARQRQVFTDPALLEALATVNAEMEPDDEAERAALDVCLSAVKGRPWELLRMHYYDGLAPAEIAARLQLAMGTVRVQLHRIRGALRDCIERRLAQAAHHD